MNLFYPIEIIKIKEEEGGGYQARIPMLGKYAFLGDGETIKESLNDLEKVKKHLFQEYINKDIQIPEPNDNEDKTYSGRFVLRIPSELHNHLTIRAKKNNTTLNQYCLYLLTENFLLDTLGESKIKIGINHAKINKINYNFPQSGGMKKSNNIMKLIKNKELLKAA